MCGFLSTISDQRPAGKKSGPSTPALVSGLTALLLVAACADDAGEPLPDAQPDRSAEQLAAPLLYLQDVSPEAPQPRISRPGPPALAPRHPVVLYLQLEGVAIKKQGGDASTNSSPLCGGLFPRFDHTPYSADRAQVLASLTARLGALLADFEIKLVTERPATPPYLMAVVGGQPTLCGYGAGIAGLAPLDCHNQTRGEVLFVFSAGITHLEMLAITIAHELGHTLGLVHSSEDCDVMSPVYCAGGKKTFLDKQMSIWPDHKGKCGLTYANSWKMMYDVLGPNPGGQE